MNQPEEIIIMAEDPAKNLTIEYAKERSHIVWEESDIAELYANVDNRAWWIADEEDDYEEGTTEYQMARETTDKWFAVEKILREKIFDILRGEGVLIPKTGQIEVLCPFMERNGYKNCAGWWIKTE